MKTVIRTPQFALKDCSDWPLKGVFSPKQNSLFEKGEKAVILFCHGYGASSFDLVPLKDLIDQENRYDAYFPQAPISLGSDSHFVAQAWFDIDWEKRLEFTHHPEKLINEFENFPNVVFRQQSDQSLNLLMKTIEGPLSHYDRFIFCGFSQGSMMVTSLWSLLTVEHKHKVSHLWNLSTCPWRTDWIKNNVHAFEKRNSWKGYYIQSHGEKDEVLPFLGGKKFYQFWQQLSPLAHSQFLAFSGQHEISLEVIEACQKSLSLEGI
jgi:predicted esterase